MDSLHTAIEAHEKKIYNLPHEEAYGWGFTGIQSIYKTGSQNEIQWSLLDRSRVIMGYVTHNHPRPSFPCPSWQDLAFMRDNNLKEMRVCSKDLFAWSTICHRVVTRNGIMFPRFDFEVYKTVIKNALDQHRVTYTTDSIGVHPREILKYSIDAMDEAILALGFMWGFTYECYTSR